MEWYQRDSAPTRNELDTEAATERWINTYERRLQAFCLPRLIDPESLEATLAYEQFINEEWSNQ